MSVFCCNAIHSRYISSVGSFSTLTLSDVFADSFNVSFNKNSYQTGDTLVISGQIIDFGMPVIAMSIFNPDGKILSANNLDLSSDGSFSKTVPLESPFYEISGVHLIKLDYGQITEEHNFVVEGTAIELETTDIIVPKIVSLYTEKDHYFDNDTIKIIGTVSSLDSPSVLIGVHDTFGTPTGFYFGNINNDLEFSTSLLVKDGVNFKTEGIYSIKAHYAKTSAEHFFEYSTNHSTNTKESIKETTSDVTNTTEDTIKDSTKDTTKTITDTNKETIKDTTEKITEESKPNKPVKENIDEKIISKKETTNENLITKTETKIISKEIETKDNPKEKILENKEHDNLSVEDIELGKLLNQINLECDSSTFVDTVSYYDGMGPAIYRLCHFDNSLKFFNESLIENPNNVEILVNKGSVLGKVGYISEAIAYYDHAIALDPDYLSAKNNKANALANIGDLDDAILLYNEILNENPNYYTARTNLNTALLIKSEIQEIPEVISMPELEIENSVNEKTLSEKTIQIKNKKEKQTNFFEELTRVFPSLFGFSE